MAIKKIVQHPNKKLRLKAEEVKDFGGVKSLVKDLEDTLENSVVPGAGLAAPQIGVSQKVFLAKDYYTGKDGKEKSTTHLFINPVIIKYSKKRGKSLEGCLSIADTYGFVERSKQIKILYYNEKGEKIIKGVGGFFAYVIQHEIDHLNGVLFIDKLVNNKQYTEKEIDKLLES